MDDVARALASVARLCPPEVHATLVAAIRRPAGGYALPVDPDVERLMDAEMRARIGDVRRPLTRRAAVEEQAATGGDPRAELDDIPTRRERRPSSTSQQIAAVTRTLERSNDALAEALERKP